MEKLESEIELWCVRVTEEASGKLVMDDGSLLLLLLDPLRENIPSA